MKKYVAAVVLLLAGAGLWWWVAAADESESPSPPVESEAPAPEPSPDLRGRVVDGSGDPVEGATVTLEGTEEKRTATTDGSGVFAFDGLAAGSYALDVRAEGFVPPGPPPLRTTDIEVTESAIDGEGERIELTIRRPATIDGRVVAGDEPLADVRLSLYYLYAEGFRGGLDPFTLSNEGTTGTDGRFELTEVAPGRLRILAESGEHGVRRSEELLIEAGQKLEDVVIDLQPDGAVAGKVVGAEGNPLAGRLTLKSKRLRNPRRVRASSDGNFRFGGLPAGTYRLVARAPGYRTREFDGITVSRDETTQRAVQLQRGKGLYGRVVGPEGEAVGGAFVRLERDGRIQWRRTGGDGRFQWKKAPDGTWTARAYSPNHSRSPAETARTGDSTQLKLEPGGWIEGRVVDSSGRAVTGARVGVNSLLVEGPQPYGTRAVGLKKVEAPDGTFRFGPLRPGRYRLEAKKSGHAAASSPQLTVGSGGTVDEVELVLGLGGTVTGVVRSKKSGKPLSGIRVSAFDMGSPFEPRSATTDQKGRYRIDRIPSGRRSLRVRGDGYLTRVVSGLEVPEGGTVQMDVSLHKKKKGQEFSFRGIGASLRRTEGGVQIRRILPGGGAEKKGLQQGDVIRGVDRESVDDLPLSSVVQKIRGRAGKPVRLTIEREGRGKFTVEIPRGRVVVQ